MGTASLPTLRGFSSRGALAATSIICIGELTSLARRRKWGTERLEKFESLLEQIPRINLDNESFVNEYADISDWTKGIDRDYPINVPPPKPANPMDQNDLWIAATGSGFKLGVSFYR